MTADGPEVHLPAAARAPRGGMPSPQELAGRIALVTGAGRGIGRAIAVELARAGAEAVLVGRTRARLEETCAAIRAGGGRARVVAADVTREPLEPELVRAASACDVLVHNAAAFAPYGLVEEVDPADVRRVLETVVLAAIRLSALALPGMKARGFGRIVHVGSVAAATGAERQVAYASAKAALQGLARSLALEGARAGVTSNLVELGPIATERIAEEVPEAVRQALVESTPAGRLGTVEEVAALVGFLASPRAGFLTGATIPLAGGLGLGLFARFPEP